MLSVDEAFEGLSQKLTPSAEDLVAVAQLHELLRETFKGHANLIASIELLSVLVVNGGAWPLFAFVLRRGNDFQLRADWDAVKKRYLRETKGGATVTGSTIVFQSVAGFLDAAPAGGSEQQATPAHALMRLGGTLPVLTEGVEDEIASLARLVILALGTYPKVFEVAALANAVCAAATEPVARPGVRLRDALATFAASQGSSQRRLLAIRAAYALTLEREGDFEGAHTEWSALFRQFWPVAVPDAIVRRDVVSAISARGIRSIDALQLDLKGLTVLIGENGAGKSTLVEVCELLRRATSPAFLEEFNTIHGGLRGLLRHGSAELALSVEVRGVDLPLFYELRLTPQGSGAVVSNERLVIGRPDDEALSVTVLRQDRTGAFLSHADHASFSRLPESQGGPAIASFGLQPPHPAIGRIIAALKGIEVHVPFEVMPAWVGRAHGRQAVLRGSSLIQATSSLERLGVNLANAWHALRSDVGEAHWRETMDYVRLGLGERIESVNTRADVAGGSIALWVKLKNHDEQVPAAALSEGMLSYLAFVAMFRLPSKRSLLVFDEPELHLHPRLLARVMGFFQSISERSSVLLATHSRRILDELRAPASSTVLCTLDEAGTTRLRYPDQKALEGWLEDYDGLGRLLDAGYESEVMVARKDL